jgi:hypothetical protein
MKVSSLVSALFAATVVVAGGTLAHDPHPHVEQEEKMMIGQGAVRMEQAIPNKKEGRTDPQETKKMPYHATEAGNKGAGSVQTENNRGAAAGFAAAGSGGTVRGIWPVPTTSTRMGPAEGMREDRRHHRELIASCVGGKDKDANLFEFLYIFFFGWLVRSYILVYCSCLCILLWPSDFCLCKRCASDGQTQPHHRVLPLFCRVRGELTDLSFADGRQAGQVPKSCNCTNTGSRRTGSGPSSHECSSSKS